MAMIVRLSVDDSDLRTGLCLFIGTCVITLTHREEGRKEHVALPGLDT